MNTFLWRVFPVALIAVRGLLKSQHALAVPVEVAVYVALVVWTVHTFLCQVYLWLKTHSLLPDVSALTARACWLFKSPRTAMSATGKTRQRNVFMWMPPRFHAAFRG